MRGQVVWINAKNLLVLFGGLLPLRLLSQDLAHVIARLLVKGIDGCSNPIMNHRGTDLAGVFQPDSERKFCRWIVRADFDRVLEESNGVLPIGDLTAREKRTKEERCSGQNR